LPCEPIHQWLLKSVGLTQQSYNHQVLFSFAFTAIKESELNLNLNLVYGKADGTRNNSSAAAKLFCIQLHQVHLSHLGLLAIPLHQSI
tara:strand:- start:1056 stop:1319 length:264 start_codon:yes stop_codon:yes gene_type:complete